MSVSEGGIPRRLSTDEFLQWLEGRPEAERWELIDGEPVRSMAPETVRHVELKRNVLEALRDAIREGGLPAARSVMASQCESTSARSFSPTRR
jgi:Uma2 family endonuclease